MVDSPGAEVTDLQNDITDPESADAILGYHEEVAIPADSFARAVAFAID